MEMRRCKECGKLFMPKGREQYCSNIHYRPCPICGDPVEAKYLSDPPRRCPKCKSIKAALAQHVESRTVDVMSTTLEFDKVNTSADTINSSNFIIEIPSKNDTRKYIGKDYKHGKGFVPGHVYELRVTKDEYSYWVNAIYDWTDNCPKDILELFSSTISINGHFQKIEE